MNWNHQTIRDLERSSIRDFVKNASANGTLSGRVLDFGAGKQGTCRTPQPYRDLVDGDYYPYDLGDPRPEGVFDAVLCTQVIQYVKDPQEFIFELRNYLCDGGSLVMSYPTAWDDIDSDLFRFTKGGMEYLLARADLTIQKHVRRADIELGGFRFPLGYGVIATN